VALLNDEDQATTLNAFGIPESARVAPVNLLLKRLSPPIDHEP
jgi:hypothetical protein